MAKIMIVEDELDIAENLAALLAAKGHKTTIVSDGADALHRIRAEGPDLILLDVMLPRLSGIDVCKLLRLEPKNAKIKVVMVTGMGRGADVEAAFAAGADDYLIKPFDSDRLFKKIAKVLAIP